MSTISLTDPQFRAALDACVRSQRRLANYELEPWLDQRLQELEDRKELLSEAQHQELMALVHFVQRRTRDKLEAVLALRRLHECCPELQSQA